MTPETVSRRWLSLRCWMLRTVLPSALTLLGTLALLKAIGPDEKTLDHTAVLVGFAALYFVLFRGGHILMIRSLHADLLRRHENAYRQKLSELDPRTMQRRNLGFTLARTKRDILMEAQEAEESRKRQFGPR